MTRRERVMRALNFEEIPAIDFGGMLSTGISCFAYPHRVKALNLPYRRPKIHDSRQMLALPDGDVLDALDCDVVCVMMDTCNNAFEEPEKWHPFDFGSRLSALVLDPSIFSREIDGTIIQSGTARMVPSSYVFDELHGGEPLDLFTLDPPKEDLEWIVKELERSTLSDERIEEIARYCKKVRESTDRAIMFNGPSMGLSFRGGMASWSMFCLTEPEYVHTVHELITNHMCKQYRRLFSAIGDNVDIFMANADDQGTQNATILPPSVFRELYVSYYKRMNDAIHNTAPLVKTFLHSCGAIYEILDDIIAAGFDVLNPIQWPAGSKGFQKWKDLCRKRIALWGGGINSQSILPFGTVDEIIDHTKEVCSYLASDGGYVFNSIHNILAEIEPDKILAMYRSAYQTLYKTTV